VIPKLEFRCALRSLMRTPFFTIATVILLALEIGANSAAITLLDRLLLRPFPGVKQLGNGVRGTGYYSTPEFQTGGAVVAHSSSMGVIGSRTHSWRNQSKSVTDLLRFFQSYAGAGGSNSNA